MEDQSLSKYTVSFGLSVAVCSVLNALLVVAKAKIPAVTLAMQKVSGHHWVTHSALIVLLFCLFSWLFTLVNGGRGPALAATRLLGFIVVSVLFGGLIIVGFYLLVD